MTFLWMYFKNEIETPHFISLNLCFFYSIFYFNQQLGCAKFSIQKSTLNNLRKGARTESIKKNWLLKTSPYETEQKYSYNPSKRVPEIYLGENLNYFVFLN